MNLLKQLSAAAALARGAVALGRIARALEHLARVQEQLLQVQCLERGVRPSKLQEVLAAAEEEGSMELLDQDQEELARIAALERMAAERGVRVRDDVGLEEQLFPGPPGGRWEGGDGER